MTTVRQGLLFKRLTLLVGAPYFTLVTVTNVVNLVASIGDHSWRVLDSGNVAHIEGLAMAVVIAVVPDDPTHRAG